MGVLYSTLIQKLHRAHSAEPSAVPGGSDGQGLVLVASGVGGFNMCGTSVSRAMRRTHAPCEVRLVLWSHGFGRWHADLTDASHLARHGRELARVVERYRADHPGLPVFLVGKSGGTAVIVQALANLPDDAVERAVLLAPALSPSYDLTRALRAVRGEVVVFWSPLDVIVLGLGTWLFGTADGIKGVSAGMVGFRPPSALHEDVLKEYAKLRQVRWRPEMARTGHLGGHLGPEIPAFLRRYVVPLLRAANSPETARDSGCQDSPAPRR
jgi:pimeloyl-ACP methyl ester carboxylesterase